MAIIDLLKVAQLDSDNLQNLYLKTDSGGAVIVGNIDNIVKNQENILTLTNTNAASNTDYILSIGDDTLHPDGTFNIKNTTNALLQASDSSFQVRGNLSPIVNNTFNIVGLLGGGTTDTGTSISLNHGGVIKGDSTITSGNLTSVNINGGLNQGFASTSGNATFTSLEVNPTINQTGTATGITRAIYINPTITAATDFRAIEVAAGEVLISSSLKYVDGNQVANAVLMSDIDGVASWTAVSFNSTLDFRYDSNLDTSDISFFRGPISLIEFYPANEIDSTKLTLDAKLDADVSWTNIATNVNATTAASNLQTWVDVTAPVTSTSLWRLRISVIYNSGETSESNVLMKYI